MLYSSGNWKDLEGTLSQNMSTCLSPDLEVEAQSHYKTLTAAFHLNNREAKRDLKVYNSTRFLPFCHTPIYFFTSNRLLPFRPISTYLRVKLHRSLTFQHHLVALRKKLSSRITLLRQFVGSGLVAGTKTLPQAALSLFYSTAEYCTPVSHTCFIGSVLNDVLRNAQSH